METIDLGVEPRRETGKGAVRVMRRTGKVPAVLYGPKRTVTHVAVDLKEFETKIGALEGSHLIRLISPHDELAGRLVLVKEAQRHPVTHTLVHADLYEVDVTSKIRIPVALHFIGRAEGVERGGILQPLKREVDVLCLPTEIPDYLEIDVSALDIHDAVHISDLKAPPGVEIPYDADIALVTVLPPVVEEVKVAEVEAVEGAVPAAGVAPAAEAAKPETPKAGAAT